MAANEEQHNTSCILDPNFAVICSFFEKFSALCGVKQHTHKELQEMIDSVEEISPELIDLHIRLMRKARKNVNPDRWQRTLAKFCYVSLPDDCFELEQKGYKELDCSQKLRILVALIGSQFDYNVKFKTDINKLGIEDLRLSPFGTDKNGNNYWLHADQDLNLKIYKEDLEEEKWELIAKNRDEVEKLIEQLMKERDPNRKLDEIENDEEEEDEDEEKEEEEEEPEKQNISDEKPETETEQQPLIEPDLEKEPSSQPDVDNQAKITAPTKSEPVKSSAAPVEPSQQQLESTQQTQKPSEPVAQKPLCHSIKNESKKALKMEEGQPGLSSESALSIKVPFDLRRKIKFADPPVKPLNKESFVEHIKTLNSHDVMRPLLFDNGIQPATDADDSLKLKINQKFNAIKPTISNPRDLLFAKASKPGLKLEQILKSKLAQKLAANSPTASEAKDTAPTEVQAPILASPSKDATSVAFLIENQESAVETASSLALTNAAPLKRKLSSEEAGNEAKKTKPCEADDEDGEIEEPMMLVTGVGSGKACDTGNETDNEKKIEPAPLNNAITNQLTHKVDDILKKGESENGESASTSDETSHLPAAKSDTELTGEKKKPKLWTIDAICSSDSKETKRSDDISSFPNYSFNRDSKKSETSLFRSSGSGESYSIFNLAADSNEDHSMSMPTNFYFGCNNQNPCFLPSERSPVNNFKPPNKSHNVKDFVDDLEAKESSHSGVGEVPKFNVESLCSKTSVVNDIPITECVDIGSSNLTSAEVTGQLLNLNREFATSDKSEETLSLPVVADVSRVAELAPLENVCQTSEAKAADKISFESTAESSLAESESGGDFHSGTTHDTSPITESETATIEHESAISTGQAVFEPTDEVKQATESTSADVINENAEPIPNDEIQGSSCTREFEIEPALKAVEEPSETVQTDEKSCTPHKPVAAEPQIEAVNEETNEKTDVDGVCTKLDAVKSPHPVPRVEEKPATNEVFDEPMHQSDQPSSPTSITDIDETKPADGSVTDKREASLLAPLASSSVDSQIQDSNYSSVVEENSKQNVTNMPISCKSHNSSVEEDDVQSSSAKSAIETTELAEEPSAAVFSAETERQPELLIEAASRPEPQSTDEKLVTATETTVSESADCIEFTTEPALELPPGGVDAKIESKDLVPEDTEQLQKIQTDEKVESTARSSSPQTGLANDVVTLPTSDTPIKLPSKDEAANECYATAPPTHDGSRSDMQLEEKTISSPKDRTSAQLFRKEGGSEESEVDEPKVASLDDVDKAYVEKSENTDESKSATETTEKLTEVNESEPDANICLAQPPESTQEDQSVESAKVVAENEYVTESKPGAGKHQDSTSENDDGVDVEQSADFSQKKSEQADLTETKAESNESQPIISDDSQETVTPRPGPGRRKSRRTEASRLLEENGPASEESIESTPTKRTTRRSQVFVDADEDQGKGKSVKGGKSQSATPATESKRGGRGSQSVVTEKAATKEPAGKKGRGKASSEETKDAEDSEKAQPPIETDDTETPAAKQPVALKKKRGRAKKLSKEKVDEVESDDEKEGESVAKSNDEDTETQNEAALNGNDKNVGSAKKSEKVVKKRVTKRGWINEVDVKNIETPNKDGSPGIRQSRRIAQLKIKEQAEVKYVEPVTTPKKAAATQKSKPVSSIKKNNTKSPNKKNKNKSNRDESEDEISEKTSISSKKKKKKNDPKKNFDITKAWKASSDSSSEEEDVEEDDHFEEDEEEIVINDASDHEFSPESDIDDDDEYTPVKRARTAHSKPSDEDKIERDDLSCQSCGTADQPEWILLCDACDEGWHASCLKPPILSIPEGDWFCPPCQHNKLITNLQKFLITFDKNVKKKANEDLRKKRLEFVDISFSNIIIDSQASHPVDAKATGTESDASGSTDDSSSSGDSEEEGVYQLRVRRQVNVSHRLNEYEELMNSAIQREDNIQIMDTGPVPEPEVGETPTMPNGDEHAPPQEQEVAEVGEDNEAEDGNDEDPDENPADDKKVAPVILNLRNIRKRPPPLTKLDVSSEDDRYSDEDFKGSSADDRDEDDSGKSETDSDEAEYRSGRHGPVRRSTRARVARYDRDFINDNSDDDDDEEYGGKKKKKKKRKRYSESESDEEDETWGSRKKKKIARPSRSSRLFHKKRKRIRFEGDSDEDRKKSVKSRIKYGLDESEDEHPQRRTRGKKINYVENLGSDSEEEDSSQKKKGKKIVSDDDEYMEEDDDKNEQNAKVESSKSESEEDDESKSDADSIRENTPTDDLEGPPSMADSTKAVSPTQPAVEPKAALEEKTIAPEVSETASLKKDDKTKVHEKIPVAEEAVTKPSMPIESAKIVNQISPAPAQQSYGDIIQDDQKTVPTIVDANSSLKGMQTMTQSLGQVTAAAAAVYVPPTVVDPKHPPVPTSSGPVPVNFNEVGIRYEDADGEKFAPPIRVISPSKLYAMQEQKRSPLPPQFAAPPHVQQPMAGLPPSRMMIPHSMPNAMQMPVPLPMGSSPQMRHPLPNPLQPPQPRMGMSSNLPTPKPKPARKSRSKKQQEQERLEREAAMEAASRGGEEMMPLHRVKGVASLPSEMNMPRPPPHPQMPPFSTASAPPFMPYPNVQPQMRFPQQPPTQSPPSATPVSAPTAGGSSKRVKITPTRMSMASPQNMMRLQRPPGSAPMYRPPQGPETATSSANQTPHNDVGTNAPTVTKSPGKPEPTSVAPPTMKPEQYYLPMSTYPPSQMPRGQHRPEFTFVRNPMPPTGYRHPVSGAAPALTVTSSYSRMPHPYSGPSTAISGGTPLPHPLISGPPPIHHSSAIKPDAAAKAPPYTVPSSTPPAPPVSYPSPHLSTPPGPPSGSSKMTPPAHAPPTSTSPYQMLHVKQLPPTVVATMQSSTAPNLIYPPAPIYYTAPMMHTQYGHPCQPPLPPGSQPYPSVPSTQAPPTSSPGGGRPAPLPPTSIAYQPPPTSSPADLPPTSMQSAEYGVPTSQPSDFRYQPQPPPAAPTVSSAPALSAAGDGENRAYSQRAMTYDKEVEEERQQAAEQQQQPQTPTEESSGEFGGLVSYFSSQHEDDLDS